MADTSAMVFSLILVPVALGLLVACVRGCWLDRDDSYSQTAYAALHSPSVRTARNAFDRRVALAVREAKQGARECDGCGFTNVVHAVSCVRCSAGLAPDKMRKTLRAAWSSQRGPKASSGVPQTDLQRRIRRRREWTRRVNEQGKLEWHREHQPQRTSQPEFRSYVLQSCSSSKSSTGQLPSDCGEPAFVTDSHEVETIEVVVTTNDEAVEEEEPIKTIADVSKQLEDVMQTTSVTITNATEADASHLAYSDTGSGSEDANPAPIIAAASEVSTPSRSSSSSPSITIDNATNAQLPFPAKLAQFVTSIAGIVGASNSNAPSSRITLPRDSLLTESVVALATMRSKDVHGAIRVDFLGEQGIDAGGVYREWFLLLNEAIVNPEAGIFTCVDQQNQSFYLNPHSREVLGEHHLAHFLAAGRLLGRALLDGNVTGFHLALPLLKIILGQPVGFDDLAYFDPAVHKHLTWLLENEGVDALCLDFTVTERLLDGSTRSVELVEGGSTAEVTEANKVEFVDAKLKYLLFESVKKQLFAFLMGIYQVVPAASLAIFDVEELDYVLSGSDEIDVNDWEANSLASNNLKVHPSLEYFWKVLRELSTEERRHLLQFATGSTRVPPGGFRSLTSNDGKLGLFNLRGVQPKTTHGYLHSHACFNRLDLPLHGSLKKMREAVRAAISSESIGFTTD